VDESRNEHRMLIRGTAHYIRSRRTNIFAAVTTLDAGHHWCLTGTPIQNSIEDVGSLLDFCHVPLLEEKNCFQKHIARPIKKFAAQARVALLQTLMPICKSRKRAILDLAEPTFTKEYVGLSKEEERRYKSILDENRRAIDGVVSGQTKKIRHLMLRTMLELRICCNVGTHTWDNKEAIMDEDCPDADESLALLQEKGEAFCVSCFNEVSIVNQFEDPTSGILGICSHALCSVCYETVTQEPGSDATYTCVVCGERTEKQHLQTTSTPGELPSSEEHSTKLNTLVRNLVDLQSSPTREKRYACPMAPVRSHTDSDSIVFSCWKKTLDLTADLCSRNGVRHIRIDGTTPQDQRVHRLNKFGDDPAISALLMTIGTGAVG
jgi:SWI/SNF-related matrix-associated actin-dependent regulator of chromatin subfamily A3